MGSPDRPAAELIERHAEELELDDESLAAITEIIASSRARGEELDFQLQEAHRRLHFLLSRDLPVEVEVMEHAETIGRIRTEESKHRLGVLLAIRAHLSAEQLEKLHGIRQEAAREGPSGQLMEACRADVESLCGDAPRGRETMMCMREHRDALSAECSAAVESTRSRARDRGWSPRGLR
jgi:Spy/CpxP family protein refolding chaperone